VTTLDLQHAGETLRLFAGRALLWPRAETLLIADVHLGKPATFRAAGIPVPEQTTDADLRRLDALLSATRARRLVVLGDLLHSRRGRAEGTMAKADAWRGRHADVEILLVRGNHDRASGDPPDSWRIRCETGPLVEEPFVFAHEPDEAGEERERGLTLLCGHVHPAVKLDGRRGASLRVPCFWLGDRGRRLVFPAFGSFTGTKIVRPAGNDRVFLIGESAILEHGAVATPRSGAGA